MKIIFPIVLLAPALAFAQAPPQKSPMQQATEAIAQEQLAAHQLWRANAIASDAQAAQLQKMLQEANAKLADATKQLTDAQKQAADLQAKLDLATEAQKEQATKCDETINSLKGNTSH
jgi:DNA anti-recombination protein RmuC